MFQLRFGTTQKPRIFRLAFSGSTICFAAFEKEASMEAMSSENCIQVPKKGYCQFLTSHHPHVYRSPFLSRATRTILTFDLAVPELVFLKDYWRTDVEATGEEDVAIHSILETNEARNVASVGMGNNASGNKVLTQTPTIEPLGVSTQGKIQIFHYKMWLDVVGRNLIHVESPREFISAVADAMKAHDTAYFDADILHGDVSVGNILIADDSKGMLVDWDKSLQSTNINTRRPSRTGTWKFMSAMLLDHPWMPHVIEDDRESAFYVLLWVAMRHTENSVRHRLYPDEDPSTLGPNLPSDNVVRAFNEAYSDKYGNIRGGWIKKWLLTSDVLSRLEFSNRPELEKLFENLGKFLDVRYVTPPSPSEVEALRRLEILIQKYPAYKEDMKFVRNGTTAFRYQNRVSQLQTKYWLANTIVKHLENLQLARRRN